MKLFIELGTKNTFLSFVYPCIANEIMNRRYCKPFNMCVKTTCLIIGTWYLINFRTLLQNFIRQLLSGW